MAYAKHRIIIRQLMGTPPVQAPSDNYFLQQHSTQNASYRYLWIDSNMTNPQNLSYLEKLKWQLKVTPLERPDDLMRELQQLSLTECKVCVVSSAGYTLRFYKQLQESETVQEVVLFTTSPSRAEQLQKMYSKITKVCLYFDALYSHLVFKQSQTKRSLGIFSQNSMGELNCWTANWRVLVQEVNRQTSKDQFIQLAKNEGSPVELLAYYNKYDIRKEHVDKINMVLQWVSKDNFFIKLPNQMLREEESPFRLAYARQPIVDIFTAIKSHYNTHSYQDRTVYVRMGLNRQELLLICDGNTLNELVYFRQFLQGTLYQQNYQQAPNQVNFVLHLPHKQPKDTSNYSTGYYIDDHKKTAVINIGTFFKVKRVQTADQNHKTVELELVVVSKRENYRSSHPLYRLQLHQKYISYLIHKFPGQLLSSYFSNRLQQYQQYVKNQVKGLLSVTMHFFDSRLSIVKRGLDSNRLKMYFGIADPAQVIERYKRIKSILLELYKDKNNEDYQKYCTKVYLGMAELSYRENDIRMLARSISKLQNYAKTISLSVQEHTIIHLYRIFLCIATNPAISGQFLIKFDQIQNGYRQKEPHFHEVSAVSQLIKEVKIKSLLVMGRERECLHQTNRLLKITAMSQGTACAIYYKFENKRDLLEQGCRQTQTAVLQSQRPFSIPLSVLPIDHFQIGSLDFQLYDDSVQLQV